MSKRDLDVKAECQNALEEWWAGVRNLDMDAYQAGKVLDLSAPVGIEEVRGPDPSIRRLFVRRDFDFLYRSVLIGKAGSWLVHLNGNSGIGKSAFLWYFIIRFAIDMGKRDKAFVLVYQSGSFIWSFHSNGKVELMQKSEFQWTSLRRANWHLVNQKVESSDNLGKRVLVAAPHPDNVKNAYPDRQLATVYMHPWDRDEFHALTSLWEEKASQLEKEVSQIDALELHGSCSLEDDMMKDELETTYEVQEDEAEAAADDAKTKVRAGQLRDQARLIRIRVGAADAYYSWFGGVPRRLWQLEPDQLTDSELESLVDTSLLKTDLGKVYRAISAGAQADDVSWMLLHLKRPQTAGCKYLLDFASSKIKYKFTSSLAAAKRGDLRVLLDSTDPQLGALRGFLFEQEVVAKVLQSEISAVLMIDDKHCSKCISRADRGQGLINWIACGVCNKWYHQSCVLSEGVPVPVKWRCGRPGCDVLTTRGLRLRYYRGDLKEALLGAGSDAVNYVWRPLRKNNGGYDFAILPATLGQATTAQYHPVPFEAVRDGLAALEAWNEKYNKQAYPERFLLSFFLSQDNYPEFGYQSYRDKQRRVSNKGVRGIRQAKVLIQTFDDEQQQLEQCADIPEPEDVVEKLDELPFEPDFQGMTVEQLKTVARENGLITGYSSLIEKLNALDEVEDLEFERSYYSRVHRALV